MKLDRLARWTLSLQELQCVEEEKIEPYQEMFREKRQKREIKNRRSRGVSAEKGWGMEVLVDCENMAVITTDKKK